MRFSFWIAALMTLAVPVGGCPGDDGDTCSDYVPPPSFDAKTPVSFKHDVFPIFQNSCAFVSCHGQEQGATNGVYLGGSDPSKVRAGLVDKSSEELPSMVRVKAGAPHDSYLMRKLDGSNCVLASQCVATANTTKGDCGSSMPRNDQKLPLDQGTTPGARDVVRRWILQGALDN